MQALQDDLLERWMTAHLRERFRRRCEPLSDPELLRFVRERLADARGHGFVGVADACRYVQVALHLGSDFDRNPALPWAAPLLAADSPFDASTRIELLQTAAAEFLRDGPPPPEAADPDDDTGEDEWPTPTVRSSTQMPRPVTTSATAARRTTPKTTTSRRTTSRMTISEDDNLEDDDENDALDDDDVEDER